MLDLNLPKLLENVDGILRNCEFNYENSGK